MFLPSVSSAPAPASKETRLIHQISYARFPLLDEYLKVLHLMDAVV